MKAIIEIKLDNAAFQEGEQELVRVIRNLAQDIEDYPTADFIGVIDMNGNKVGHFEIVED
jgi:hypothetical protein